MTDTEGVLGLVSLLLVLACVGAALFVFRPAGVPLPFTARETVGLFAVILAWSFMVAPILSDGGNGDQEGSA